MNKFHTCTTFALAALLTGSVLAPSLFAEPPVPPRPPQRVPGTEMGIDQLPNDKLDWLLDAKFGMFIHWGLYSGVGKGEWYMEQNGILPDAYRKYAYPESGDAYFDAADYDPAKWASLAKDAGMKWMCLTTRHPGGWGYNTDANVKGHVMSRDTLIRYLANCTVRDMVLLVNVAPDRHGVIPDVQQKPLREMGAWLEITGAAIYGTRGGPWQPKDREFGYCYKGNTLYVHLLNTYKGDTFTLPPLGTLKVQKISDVFTGKPLTYAAADDAITISGLDRTASPADTIIAVTCDAPVESIWPDAAGH